jgi:hypothetical protein
VKFNYINEPLLEFGVGEDICPRRGISKFGVYDSKSKIRNNELFVGCVGTSSGIDFFYSWIEKCKKRIPAKEDNKQPNLFSSFCGFNEHYGFKAKITTGEEIYRTIKNSSIKSLLNIESWDDRVIEAVELYYEQIKFLAQNRNVNVIICIIPDNLYSKISKIETTSIDETIDQNDFPELELNFRRLLKAKAMHLGKPLQLVREVTFSENKSQQDIATKAWNFCTALYYKAGSTIPWKIKKNPNRPSSCFVGISFYRSRDHKSLNTSLAQIFDELGNGVILRGTPVELDKTDLRPHLNNNQIYNLLSEALNEYRIAMGNLPSRLVIHKTSNFYEDEIEGIYELKNKLGIETLDLVTIIDTSFRIFRTGMYPPLRGTYIKLDTTSNILFTRGSVPYYKTYPALYIPQPLEIRVIESDESPERLCEEILALTKMNWNNTQFDGKYPITIGCSRKVGQIMKYLKSDDKPQIRYSFYM